MNDDLILDYNFSNFNTILNQYSNEPMHDKDLHAFFNTLYQATIENNQDLKYVKWHKDLFLYWETKCLNAGIKSKNEIIEQLEEAKILVKQNYFLDQKTILSSRGINAYPHFPNDPSSLLSIPINHLGDVINDFISSTDFCFVEVIANNHVMMLAVEVNQHTCGKNFSFFDPNFGIYYSDNIEDIKELLSNLAEFYNVVKLSNGDLNFGFRFYSKSDEKSDYQRNNFIERKNVNLTILNKLIESEEIIKVQDNISIKYLDYDKENNLTELRLTNHGRLFNENKLIFIDNLDPDEINHYIKVDYEKLLKVPTERIYLGKDKFNFSFSILPISDGSELLHAINKKKIMDVHAIGLMA